MPSCLSASLEIRGLLYIEDKWVVVDRFVIYRKDCGNYHVQRDQWPFVNYPEGVDRILRATRSEIDISCLKYKQILSLVKMRSRNCDRCEFSDPIDLSWDYTPDADILKKINNVLFGCRNPRQKRCHCDAVEELRRSV